MSFLSLLVACGSDVPSVDTTEAFDTEEPNDTEEEPDDTAGLFDIQAALDAALPGAVVDVPCGTFPGHLILPRPVTLRGAGSECTVLLGTGEGSVVVVLPEGGEVRIEGLSITGGTSGSIWLNPVDEAHWEGGGGLSVLGTATLADVRVFGNRAREGGGAFVAYGGYEPGRLVAERDVVFEDNEARSGQAIYVWQATVDLAGATIRANRADADGWSAAVAAIYGDLTFGAETSITENEGGHCGGFEVFGTAIQMNGFGAHQNEPASAREK